MLKMPCGSLSHVLRTVALRGHNIRLFSRKNNTSESESEFLYYWRFAANQFVLAPSPLRSTTRYFYFLQLNPCGHSPYVTSALTRWWVCLLWIGFAFVKCTYCTYSMYWKFILVRYIQVFCQSRLCKADHDSLIYLMLQRQLSHLNGRKVDRRQV
jgi:hypothetical protein